MKRYTLPILLGLTVTLLALAPQLRADGTDHANDSHAMAANVNSHGDSSDLRHADAWGSNGDWDTAKGMCSGNGDNDGDDNDNDNGHGKKHGKRNHGNSGSGSGGDCGGDSSSGSGSTSASTPEPSSLLLLLTAFVATALSFVVKKAAA